jgi:hypothetical protein
MSAPDDLALQEIERFLESARALRAELRASETTYRRLARLLTQGDQVHGALEAVDASVRRHDLTEALDALERQRHQVKVALAADGLRQGMTIGDLGRAWGVSRQLAARYAKEARQLG